MFYLHRNNALQRWRSHEIEILRLRSVWLSAEDKVFMQMVLENGSTFEAIARLTGRNPSTVSRRFHRLVNQLIARELAPLPGSRANLNCTAVCIIRDYFLQGQSQKAIAQKRNISLYRIRHILRSVRSTTCNRRPSAPVRTRRSRQKYARIKRNKNTLYTKGAHHAHPESQNLT